jgi:hypothetical protein
MMYEQGLFGEKCKCKCKCVKVRRIVHTGKFRNEAPRRKTVVLCKPENLFDWSRNSGPVVSRQKQTIFVHVPDILKSTFWIFKNYVNIPVIRELVF